MAWLLTTLLLAVFAVAPAGCDNVRADSEETEEPPRETVKIGQETFKLEYAVTDEARTKGLMGREEIGEHGGMLFVFPDVKLRSFWMKSCLVDIDVMFLDPRGRITALHRMKAEPPQREGESLWQYETRLKSYPSRRRAQFAVELKSGWLGRLDLKVGDKIELDLERLKKMAR